MKLTTGGLTGSESCLVAFQFQYLRHWVFIFRFHCVSLSRIFSQLQIRARLRRVVIKTHDIPTRAWRDLSWLFLWFILRCVEVGAVCSHGYLSNICSGAKRRQQPAPFRPSCFVTRDDFWSLEREREGGSISLCKRPSALWCMHTGIWVPGMEVLREVVYCNDVAQPRFVAQTDARSPFPAWSTS